ncbi:MAG: hypothetical protein JST30_01435 [Armatimonadetes bacterium]|nr:hypothetical protein [Armatimonadota bacterium]
MYAANKYFGIQNSPLSFAFDFVESTAIPWAISHGTLDAGELAVQQSDVSVQPEPAGFIVAGFVLISGASS